MNEFIRALISLGANPVVVGTNDWQRAETAFELDSWHAVWGPREPFIDLVLLKRRHRFTARVEIMASAILRHEVRRHVIEHRPDVPTAIECLRRALALEGRDPIATGRAA